MSAVIGVRKIDTILQSLIWMLLEFLLLLLLLLLFFYVVTVVVVVVMSRLISFKLFHVKVLLKNG